MLTHRRSFLGLAGATAIAGPVLAQPRGVVKRVGVLYGARPGDAVAELQINEVRIGLAERGWVDGGNLTIDVRLTLADPALAAAYAAELVAMRPDALLSGSTTNALALQAATNTIPIVFESVQDPVGAGLVASFARPGGNITGFTNFEPTILTKHVELLSAIAPATTTAVLLFNPNTAAQRGELFRPYFEEATSRLGIAHAEAHLSSVDDVDAVFESIGSISHAGIVIPQDNFFFTNRSVVIAAIDRTGIPTVCSFQDMVKEGGLIGYTPDSPAMYRQGGYYLARILGGADPGSLPVQAPTRFLLVINLRTAASQGITIPFSLLATADIVIE